MIWGVYEWGSYDLCKILRMVLDSSTVRIASLKYARRVHVSSPSIRAVLCCPLLIIISSCVYIPSGASYQMCKKNSYFLQLILTQCSPQGLIRDSVVEDVENIKYHCVLMVLSCKKSAKLMASLCRVQSFIVRNQLKSKRWE